MNSEWKKWLTQVKEGTLSVEEAERRIKADPFEDIGFAKVDHHRRLRQGTTEIIYGEGKTAEQIGAIAAALRGETEKSEAAPSKTGDCAEEENRDISVLVTRVSEDKARQLPEMKYYPEGRLGLFGEPPIPTSDGTVLIVTGGTTDIPVAEEAALTAQLLGSKVDRCYDVGVSGLHRLLSHLEEIQSANVIVAVAGMEGALASVVGGLVDCPVIAVPTSVGYGSSFDGLAALLSMLNSCASGVATVNIDNGFGAGYLAHMINQRTK